MSERKWTDPCKCTFHQKMAGDGCDLCNPDRAKELKEEDGVMSERREGWYWVKYSGRWQCAEWNADLWQLAYGDADDEMLDCIGSRIPTPDENWQCVPKEPTDIESIIANSPLNDAGEVAIQSFLVDYNTHPIQEEFDATGINGYFQWWRAQRSVAPKPEDV